MRKQCALVMALFVSSAVAASSADKLTGIPLVWKATKPVSKYGSVTLTGIADVQLRLQPLGDGREDRSKIAENREGEKKGKIRTVTTSADVAAFCTEHLEKALKEIGLRVSRDKGDVTLTGEVARFFVTERNTYVGDVRLKLRLVGAGDRELWSGVASGSEEHFGRSYKAENYYETFSDSLLAASVGLVKEDAFRAALTSR